MKTPVIIDRERIIRDNIRRSLRYLEKARVCDTCDQHEQSRENVSLAISKLSFLLDWMEIRK